MTPEQFCYWLQGMVEVDVNTLTPLQVKAIKDHLNLVFKKVTPNYPIGPIKRIPQWQPPVIVPDSSPKYETPVEFPGMNPIVYC